MAIRKTANRGVLPVCSTILARATQPLFGNAMHSASWNHNEVGLSTSVQSGSCKFCNPLGSRAVHWRQLEVERPLAYCPYKF